MQSSKCEKLEAMKAIKTFILMIFIVGLLLQNTNGQSQKATIYGYVFLVTQRDTVRLAKARLELFRVTGVNTPVRTNDCYTDGNGRYIVADIPYGSYYFRIYYGREQPLLIITPAGLTNKGPVFCVDRAEKGVVGMYVRNP